MGTAKAARVAAMFEIARRMTAEKPIEHPTFDVDLTGAALVRAMIRQRQERIGAYFLDSRQKILLHKEIFVGTISTAAVSTRDILRAALDENAIAVVVHHNHPSGDSMPSGHDLEFTTRLRDALALADIELLDHLITGGPSFYSMKRKGLF